MPNTKYDPRNHEVYVRRARTIARHAGLDTSPLTDEQVFHEFEDAQEMDDPTGQLISVFKAILGV